MVQLSVQAFAWKWELLQLAPTFVLRFVLWGVAMFAAVWVERIMKRHDLMTYHEIVSYWNGEPVDRETEQGRRLRSMSARAMEIRVVVMPLLSALVGALMGYGGVMVANHFLG